MSTYIIESAADVLDAAAQEIDIHGWCKNTYQDSSGRLCVTGAIRKTLHGPALSLIYEPWVEIEFDAYGVFRDYLGDSPEGWNDFICTDQLNASETLRRAAKQFREENS